MDRPIIFIGPSLRKDKMNEGFHNTFDVRPPARRGDIEKILKIDSEPKTIILVDGVFGRFPSVGHTELLKAINGGFTIWGLSSMGAIRAYEMRDFGIKGFGYVYDQFFRYKDFTDDELSLIHAEAPFYFALTEPLINLRYFLNNSKIKNFITNQEMNKIIANLQQLYFGKRTLDLFRMLILKRTDLLESEVDKFLEEFDDYRIKSIDFEVFIDKKLWK